MYVIKRDGSEVNFDVNRIINAIERANKEVPDVDKLTYDEIKSIADKIEKEAKETSHSLNVEDIQDKVEDGIYGLQKFSLGRCYSRYRYERALKRKKHTTDGQILSLVNQNNEEIKQENSNKNPTIGNVQRDYMAGEVSKDITRRYLLDEDIIKAHDEGIIHFHDTDYFANKMHNCGLVNLKDMLGPLGTVISEVMIDSPKSFATACNIGTQIMAQVASSQYGGQSISIAHLAPFVDVSRQKFRKRTIEELGLSCTYEELQGENKELVDRIVKMKVKEEINRGVQTIQYQVVTLMTTNGQAPFITLFMYINEVPEGQTRDDLVLIIEEMLKQRILGVKNEKGVYITPAFPKLIYVLDENNVYPDSKYFWLTQLAAKCTAKRLVPDYISAKKMKELKKGAVFPVMGCRSALTAEPDILDENGNMKFYGRFNQGVVTINLPDVALSSNKDMNKFWEIFEERLELCHKALRRRHERLLGTPSDVAPIIWQYGGYARLKKGETIDKLLYGGYSTISLGYAGLAECVKAMLGVSHTSVEGHVFAIAVMQKMNDKCNEWREAENIAYSLYGTPIESTTYKFAKCLRKRFGVVEGVTDKNYITNSYHVHVTENIDAFEKLAFESEFQALSPGGAISYIETPDLQNNIEAITTVLEFIYNNIMYAELNSKSDYCQVCGYDGEIKIVEDENNKLVWECPCCKNRDQNKMNVARRTCGYIGSQFWNQGRTQEIKERVLHLDNME